MVRTECQLCGKKMFIQALRSHTKKNHEMSISDYKERFRSIWRSEQKIAIKQHFILRVELLEKVYHQCGLCGELILHDKSDNLHFTFLNKLYLHEFITNLLYGIALRIREGWIRSNEGQTTCVDFKSLHCIVFFNFPFVFLF